PESLTASGASANPDQQLIAKSYQTAQSSADLTGGAQRAPLVKDLPPGDSRSNGFTVNIQSERPAAAASKTEDESNTRPQLQPVIQVAFESVEPEAATQTTREDTQTQRTVDQRPASQFTRPVSNAGESSSSVQEARVVQAEPGQVPANIGQVDVQALDQLGVVILR